MLLDSVPAESLGRWAALLADAPRLGIAVIFLDDSPLATTRIELDATGTVTVLDSDSAPELWTVPRCTGCGPTRPPNCSARSTTPTANPTKTTPTGPNPKARSPRCTTTATPTSS